MAERLDAMRRVLESFAEAGWISGSALTSEHLLFTPTSSGLDQVPHVLAILRAINDDITGETAACTFHLCEQLLAEDNYADLPDRAGDAHGVEA